MEFKWINEGEMTRHGDAIEIIAPAHTDFFCNGGAGQEEGIDPESLCNAPFYYAEVEGDFVLRTKVTHAFESVYDSCSIMVMQDMTHWAKSCFERTDFGTHAVVSVVTKGNSDDANGPNVEGDAVWLQMCRKGDSFAFHYSLDGERFYMTRFFTMPVGPVAKVGLLAQAPTGQGGVRRYEQLSIEARTVANIRMGI